jgi:4-amino-4-deoxy-L-arabinose transferase-like glycosyltransferase
MVLLLPSAWLGCFLLLREATARRGIRADWRYCFILATAAFGVLLALGTEVLGLATMLNAPGVQLFWLLTNAALWGGLFLSRRRAPARTQAWTFAGGLKELRAGPLDAQLLLAAALLFAAFLGAIALFTPTTNWDSLTYHMARVMHWIQQGSVAHYRTNTDAQIQMGPWSAFVQAHLWLLWGNDRWANMLQWSAMLGCLVTATLLVRQLLPDETALQARAQAFAALLVVTLPTGIVESITTQTDYTVALWLMCLASLGLAWCREPANRAYAAGFGAALGLGVLTKFTLVIYAAPIGLAVAVVLLSKQRHALPQLLLPGASALALCLALTLPHFLRNQSVYGSAVGSKSVQEGHGIRHPSLGAILFNVLHNLELHTNTGMEPVTHRINHVIHAVEKWTGQAADDPGLSILSKLYEAPDEFFVFDSFAASPWHVALIAAALVMALANPRKHRLALTGMGLALTGLVLFCGVLRWQMWNSRYHLPELVLLMPLVAALLTPRIPRWSTCTISAGLLVFGIVIVANNRSRPIFNAAWRAQPRMEQLFSFQGVALYAPMRLVVSQIMAADCAEVGLKFSGDHPEYPFWLMLREAGFKGNIRHEFVEGPSARLPAPVSPADVIVTTLPGKPVGEMAIRYPTATEVGPTGAQPLFTLYWSAKISEKHLPATKAE